jgi:subtilase family serine protease
MYTRRFLGFFACLFVLSATSFAGQSLVRVEGAPDISQLQPAFSQAISVNSLRIGLSLKNVDSDGSDAFVLSQYDPKSPNFHKWIDGEEYGRRFGAPDSDVLALTNYLKAHGFSNISVAPSKLFISADAKISDVETAFNTKIENYQRPGYLIAKGEPATTYAPSAPIKLPTLLAAKVASVHGLTDISMQHPVNVVKKIAVKGAKKQGVQIIAGYGPYGISTGYDTDAVHSSGYYGQSMDIAVYSPTQFTKADVGSFAAQANTVYQEFTYGYQISGYTIDETLIDGGPTSSSGSTEAALDAEMIVGQAPNATVNMIEPADSTTAEIDAFNKVLALKYPVCSSSWGREEHSIIANGLQSFATTFNNTIKTLAAAGISVFVASGDSGGYSKTSYPAITTQMESGSQWVTSVGGTNLQLAPLSRDWLSETGWIYNKTTDSGGGGGLSRLFTRPTWQTGPGVLNVHSNGYRQLPDVSANADPASGYAIYTSAEGGWQEIGGTSASTPLWASNLLLIDQYLGGSCGLLSVPLYTFGNQFENPAVDYAGSFYLFHDITIGFNGLVNATPDWDYCTGWGSVNYLKLLNDLGSYFNLKNYGPDFAPYNPHSALGFSAWNCPMMIHSSTTTVAEPASYLHTDTLYFAVCMANEGYADGPACTTGLEIDGVIKANPVFHALPPAVFGYYNNVYSTTLAAGTHIIKFGCNYGNHLHESNFTNNLYTRTIVVH